MKPRYVLHEGQPVRVAWIQGKHVGLVQVQPDRSRQQDQCCSQCAFYSCVGTPLFDGEVEMAVFGRKCTEVVQAAYREFPQPLRSGE